MLDAILISETELIEWASYCPKCKNSKRVRVWDNGDMTDGKCPDCEAVA